MAVQITAKALGGTHEITISGDNEQDAIRQIALFSALPPACPECAAGLFFTYRKVQQSQGKRGGEYFGLRCLGEPAHEKYFHVHNNEAKTLYWVDKEKFEVEYAARQGEDARGYSGNDYEREQWSENPPTVERQATQAVPSNGATKGITEEQKWDIKNWLDSKSLTQKWAQEMSKKLFGGRLIGELTEVQGAQVIKAFEMELSKSTF